MDALTAKRYKERLYPIKTTSNWKSGQYVIEKVLPLTLRERLAILFRGGLYITIVHTHKWNAYIKDQLEERGAT